MGKTKKQYRKEKNKMGAILKEETKTTETKTKEKNNQRNKTKNNQKTSGKKQRQNTNASAGGGLLQLHFSGTFDPLDRYLLIS